MKAAIEESCYIGIVLSDDIKLQVKLFGATL